MWFNCSLITKKSPMSRSQARPECSGYNTDDNKKHNEKI